MAAEAVLYLLVGLPGSGKTTRTREIERTQHALRLTPDEWMLPLFGEPDAGGKRDLLEGQLIGLALRALQVGVSVILDFGFWAGDERSALESLAESVGARTTVIYLHVDESTQLERTRARFLATPHMTVELSPAELAGWRALFQVPTGEEVSGALHPPPPVGYQSWSHWAAARWPSLPSLSDMRIG
jgi:predicted kinase